MLRLKSAGKDNGLRQAYEQYDLPWETTKILHDIRMPWYAFAGGKLRKDNTEEFSRPAVEALTRRVVAKSKDQGCIRRHKSDQVIVTANGVARFTVEFLFAQYTKPNICTSGSFFAGGLSTQTGRW